MLSPGHGNTTSAKKARARKFDWLRFDREHGIACYLIYRYKGEIRVKKGIKGRYVFYPDSNPYTWMTSCPQEFMYINSCGRVLVRYKSNIRKGVDKVRDYYAEKLNDPDHMSPTTLKYITECINSDGYVMK